MATVQLQSSEVLGQLPACAEPHHLLPFLTLRIGSRFTEVLLIAAKVCTRSGGCLLPLRHAGSLGRGAARPRENGRCRLELDAASPARASGAPSTRPSRLEPVPELSEDVAESP